MASRRVGMTLRIFGPCSRNSSSARVASLPVSVSSTSPYLTRSFATKPLLRKTPHLPSSCTKHFSSGSSCFARDNIYNPYEIAETPEEAVELEPPVRYYKDTRFDEPDYDMPKAQVHAIYAQQRPSDLFTNFEVSRDPVEWSYVERLIAPPFIPPPPLHAHYPTPSGWTPPNPDPSLSWAVRRKKDHHYDIVVKDQWKLKSSPVGGGGFMVTTVSGIEGDIWIFRRDALAYLTSVLPPAQKWQKRRPREIETRVDEVEGKLHFKGILDQKLKDFLLSKGM